MDDQQEESSDTGAKTHSISAEDGVTDAWLAPPPLIKQDGEIDREWGLPDERLLDEADVDPLLTEKLAKFHKLKHEQDTHFNESLMRSRAFHNPHIYAKLVDWLDIDETASAYGEMCRKVDVDAIWTASRSARAEMIQDGNAERLAGMQKQMQIEAEEAKRRGGRSKIDFVSSSQKRKYPHDHPHKSDRNTNDVVERRSDRTDGRSRTAPSSSQRDRGHKKRSHRS